MHCAKSITSNTISDAHFRSFEARDEIRSVSMLALHVNWITDCQWSFQKNVLLLNCDKCLFFFTRRHLWLSLARCIVRIAVLVIQFFVLSQAPTRVPSNRLPFHVTTHLHVHYSVQHILNDVMQIWQVPLPLGNEVVLSAVLSLRACRFIFCRINRKIFLLFLLLVDETFGPQFQCNLWVGLNIVTYLITYRLLDPWVEYTNYIYRYKAITNICLTSMFVTVCPI